MSVKFDRPREKNGKKGRVASSSSFYWIYGASYVAARREIIPGTRARNSTEIEPLG